MSCYRVPQGVASGTVSPLSQISPVGSGLLPGSVPATRVHSGLAPAPPPPSETSQRPSVSVAVRGGPSDRTAYSTACCARCICSLAGQCSHADSIPLSPSHPPFSGLPHCVARRGMCSLAFASGARRQSEEPVLCRRRRRRRRQTRRRARQRRSRRARSAGCSSRRPQKA